MYVAWVWRSEDSSQELVLSYLGISYLVGLRYLTLVRSSSLVAAAFTPEPSQSPSAKF